jgi:hypothetical protein
MLNEGNQIHNCILCVCENFSDTILLQFRFRFRFHNAKSYGSYGPGSGSTTLMTDKGLKASPANPMENLIEIVLLNVKK